MRPIDPRGGTGTCDDDEGFLGGYGLGTVVVVVGGEAGWLGGVTTTGGGTGTGTGAGTTGGGGACGAIVGFGIGAAGGGGLAGA